MSLVLYSLLSISFFANSADLSLIGGKPNSQLSFVKKLLNNTSVFDKNVADRNSTKWFSILSKKGLASVDVLVADSTSLNYNSFKSVLDLNQNKIVLAALTPEMGFLCLQMKKQTQVVFVLPSGDNRKNLNRSGVKWCQAPNIIFVGGLSKSGRLARFSNYGNSYLRIAAPAQNIRVINNAGKTRVMNSTNAAAAIVASELALFSKKFPRLSGLYLADRFLRSRTYGRKSLSRLVRGGRVLLKSGKKLN